MILVSEIVKILKYTVSNASYNSLGQCSDFGLKNK